jgi:hypothetical protein
VSERSRSPEGNPLEPGRGCGHAHAAVLTIEGRPLRERRGGLLRQAQLIFLGNPFVRLARMLDAIFKLAIVTLRKSRGYRVYTSRGVQAP